MNEIIDNLTIAVLLLAACLSVGRVVRKGTLTDRVLGADTLIVIIGAAVAYGAGVTGDRTYLPILVVITMLGFIATLTVARFIERRGSKG
jgi:multicomponent Na+:H+ antiporter subunit F